MKDIMIEEKPFFSVIMPVYNVENFVAESIESVLNQSLKDFELIIVNDGSQDKSFEICQEYKNAFPGLIKLYTQMNTGLLMTRSKGRNVASGKYILNLDSDDKLDLLALEKIKKTILETDCDLLFFNLSRDENLKLPLFDFPFPNLTVFEGKNKKELYELLYTGTSFNNLGNKVFKSEIAKIDVNWNDYKSIGMGEDLIQSIFMLTQTDKITFLKENLYYYRPNKSSMSFVFHPNFYKTRKIIYKVLKENLMKLSLEEKEEHIDKRFLVTVCHSVSQLTASTNKTIFKQGSIFLDEISSDTSFRKVYESGL